MLLTHFKLSYSNGETSSLSLKVVHVSGRRIADYAVSAWQDDAQRPEEALLQQYPRWSESASGLVARGLHALWPEGLADAALEEVSRIDGQTALLTASRGVAIDEWAWQQGDFLARNDELGYRQGTIPIGPADTLLHRCLCAVAWDVPLPPAWPQSPDVPVQESDGLRYVRLADIPEPARQVFYERMQGSTAPVISHEGVCFYAWDWQDFLEGSR